MRANRVEFKIAIRGTVSGSFSISAEHLNELSGLSDHEEQAEFLMDVSGIDIRYLIVDELEVEKLQLHRFKTDEGE